MTKQTKVTDFLKSENGSRPHTGLGIYEPFKATQIKTDKSKRVQNQEYQHSSPLIPEPSRPNDAEEEDDFEWV